MGTNSNDSSNDDMSNIIISAYLNPPFYYMNQTTGEYDGFYVAFSALLAQQLGFVNYTIHGSASAGTYNVSSGNWTGVIGDVRHLLTYYNKIETSNKS